MSSLEQSLFDELDAVPLVDSHSHIDPRSPASQSVADLLGYHYYTELVHSSGMPRERIEEPGITARQKVERLFESLEQINQTVQWSWFLELSQELFDIPAYAIERRNWADLFDRSARLMAQPDWAEKVLDKSRVERIFLTNDFDDPLNDFDTHRYVPCLRTDDLVFHLHLPKTQSRLEQATGTAPTSLESLHRSIGHLFDHFLRNNARACAISLPPWFTPTPIAADDRDTQDRLQRVLASGEGASIEDRNRIAYWVFWRLAEFCHEHRLPFDLMIGVHRRVYPKGVFQGQDLYDSRWSMIQYAELFNAFPNVKFPISVLASVSNQELVDYSWIFPNVYPHGHWWYSNTPTFIEHDLRARLEAVPRNKLLGYYSDAYKLEFILPKYRMYKRILAKVLAETICKERHKSEAFAIELGKQVLRGNVDTLFFPER